MNKGINAIIALLVVLITALGCDDFVDSIPRGQIIAKTTSDFRQLLDNVDNERYRYSLSQTYAYVDVVSDDVYADSSLWESWTATREHIGHLYAFDEEVWTYGSLDDDINWKTLYYVSSLTSNILAEIHKANDNPELQRQLVAETKVHRAYAYLALVNIYAKQYNAQTADQDAGVPIVLNPAQLPALERNTVQEVYGFIISELEASIEDLPEDRDQYTHRPTKVAVYAILARTYLYMGNYEMALENANNALDIRNVLYDYNTIYSGAPHADNVNGISRTADEEMLLHKTTAKGYYLENYMIMDHDMFNSLYNDFTVTLGDTVNQDLRRSLWFEGLDEDENVVADSVAFVFNNSDHRYGTDGFNSDAADNVPISTPEMYLIRAECNARIGNLGPALDDINTIRMNRFKTGTYTNLTPGDFGNDQQQILDEVLLERRRELYGKGLRLFDVKRLGIPVTHTLGSATIEVPANDPRMIWPIFNGYIEKNPELQQNDRSSSGVTVTM